MRRISKRSGEPRTGGFSDKLYAGRLAAKLFVAAGLLTLVNNHIPPYDHLNRPSLYAVGLSAIAWGVLCWFLPWKRWHPRATLGMGLVALVHVSAANFFGGVSAYSYAVYFVVVFVYIGMTQPPFTSLMLSPVAAAAYMLPSMMKPDSPAIEALSATVAIPVCVLVGEVISRASTSQRRSQFDSERRADLLAALAWASRNVNTLDADVVLETVVDAAVGLGFEAGEICVYDEAEAVHSAAFARGLPAEYVAHRHPIESGIAGRARKERRTVRVGDYAEDPLGIRVLRDAGFRSVAASPIWAGGRLVAALIIGTRIERPITEDDIEALELLAAQAGRALENARRFEAERETVERYAELDRLKEEFISHVSHELRTPLTVITGLGETLASRWDGMSEQVRADLLRRLNRNAEQLDKIISELLDFSRLEQGRLEVRLEPTLLRALCGSVAGRLRSLFETRPLHLELAADPVVMADPTLIERVIENILANAASHTPDGTHVTCLLRIEGGHAIVSVSDDGPGIAPEDLQRIGRRFFRGGGADTHRTRGTGLGLAFSNEVLRLHGTTLEVESVPGEGARFSFSLPLITEPPIEISAPEVPVPDLADPVERRVP